MNPLAPYLTAIKAALVGLLLIALAVGGIKLYRAGYHAAETTWTTKYETLVTDTERASNKEALRQSAVNQRARLAAEELEAQHAAELEARNATIKELEDEARADRDAGRLCLGADSVRRITKATPPGGRKAHP